MEETESYQGFSFLNAIIIGFMVGIYEVIGRRGAQPVINMAGEYVGKEILRFARTQGKELASFEDLRRFLIEQDLTRQLDFRREEDIIHARIAQCRICPKKVGHYSFDGTACPWGGILGNLLGQITEERFSIATRLTPGETCEIQIVSKGRK